MNGEKNCFSLDKGPLFNIPLDDYGNNMLTRVSQKNDKGYFTISELEVWQILEIKER